jgi:molecular chaperone GrpE
MPDTPTADPSPTPRSDPASGEPEPGPSPAAPPAEPAEDWGTRYRYLLADFENFRRRTERERESITRQARGALLRELLPILEAFQGARDAASGLPAKDPLRHGLELLDREWNTFLKREGVTPVAAVGEPFRPEEEEAVGEAPASERAGAGTVAEVVQQGYRFYGGVIRPAKVVVARSSPPPAPAPASAEPAGAP